MIMLKNRTTVMAIIILMSSIIVFYIASLLVSGELSDKDKWAMLQGLELKHRRDRDISKIILLQNNEGSGYDIVAIPTNDKNSPYTWLMLNDTDHQDQLFMLPDARELNISCEYIRILGRKINIDSVVLSFLNKKCR